MTEQLLELWRVVANGATGHETMETTLRVVELAEGEDPVIFLLREIRDLSNEVETYKELYERWEPTRDLVQNNENVQTALGCGPGDIISNKVNDFLKEYALANAEELEAQRAAENARIDAIIAAQKRRCGVIT